MYEGNLNVDELHDWINAKDKYFDYQDVGEDKRVKYDVTRLEGHAALWWDELQPYRRRKGKEKVALARYINGLRYEIQDEISILTLRTVENAYEAALTAPSIYFYETYE